MNKKKSKFRHALANKFYSFTCSLFFGFIYLDFRAEEYRQTNMFECKLVLKMVLMTYKYSSKFVFKYYLISSII